MPSSTTHIYVNIIVARMLPNGEIGWMRKLLKGSESTSFVHNQKDGFHRILFVEDNNLIEYKLNDLTGAGERKEIIKFKPLLKRKDALFTSRVGFPMLLPDQNAVILEAHLSGDAGTFGESKPYKEDVMVKVLLD